MTEVTVGQFLRYLRTRAEGDKRVARLTKPDISLDAPVTRLTWYDAVAYCNWLSQLEGIPPDQMVLQAECRRPVRGGDENRGRVAAPTRLSAGDGGRMGECLSRRFRHQPVLWRCRRIAVAVRLVCGELGRSSDAGLPSCFRTPSACSICTEHVGVVPEYHAAVQRPAGRPRRENNLVEGLSERSGRFFPELRPHNSIGEAFCRPSNDNRWGRLPARTESSLTVRAGPSMELRMAKHRVG